MQRLFAGLSLFLLATSTADACTCIGLPPGEEGVRIYLDSSDLVFLGRIETVTYEDAEHRGKPYQRRIAKVVVLEGFKGVSTGDNISLLDSAHLCGLTLRERESFLIFVSVPEDGSLPGVLGCTNFLIESPSDLVPSRASRDTSRAKQALFILRRIS